MHELDHLRIAVLAGDGVEEREIEETLRALRGANAQIDVIAPRPGELQACKGPERGRTIPVTRTLDEARASDYDALVLPGGALSADRLRVDLRARRFIRDFGDKPLAALGHAPWLLISAGLVRGRTLSGASSIQEDLRNAGGEWVDAPVQVDRNWVTCGAPDSPEAMAEFFKEAIGLFSRTTPKIVNVSESA